jgi:hypothetical protein
VPVARTYNPSYSGGRDQEDQGSKPTGANSSQKRTGGVVQGVGPDFKSQYHTNTQTQTHRHTDTQTHTHTHTKRYP